jgi:hypothetical protein
MNIKPLLFHVGLGFALAIAGVLLEHHQHKLNGETYPILLATLSPLAILLVASPPVAIA